MGDPKDDMLKAFRLFDDDNTGSVSFKNLKRVSRETNQTLTDDELQAMLEDADRDGDGVLNEEEFLRMMKKLALYRAYFRQHRWNNFASLCAGAIPLICIEMRMFLCIP